MGKGRVTIAPLSSERTLGHRIQGSRVLVNENADLALVAAWSAIGVGAALNTGYYSVAAVTLVSLATLVLALLTIVRATKHDPSDRPTDFSIGVAAVVFAALALPVVLSLGLYASAFQLELNHTVTALSAILVAGLFILGVQTSRLVTYTVIALMFWAGVAIVLANPAPLIDVWHMLQAAANGLSHGRSMYKLHWFAIPGQDSNGFAYLPGCAVILWPFYLVTHDVRYGELVAFVLTALILMRARGGRNGALIGSLAVLYPAGLFGIEQAWIEPVMLLEITAAAYACTRGHKRLAVVAFGAALVTKQYAWLFVPLAAVWEDFGWRRAAAAVGGAVGFLLPWFLVAPHGFFENAFLSNTRLSVSPSLLNSLSLYTVAILHGWHAEFVITVLATVAAIGLALWRGDRDTRGFFINSAFVIATLNLASYHAYFDQWEFAAGLVLAAIAFGGTTSVEVTNDTRARTFSLRRSSGHSKSRNPGLTQEAMDRALAHRRVSLGGCPVRRGI
jgi:hypothetical protein